jgi:hypothetical protein
MSDDADAGISVAEQHPGVLDRTQLALAKIDGSQFNTIRAPMVPVACWRLGAPGFAFDSSFVAPAFKDEISKLGQIVTANPGCPAALFGHCDPVGSDDLNKTLGDRRVIAMYALLTRQVAMWAGLYDNPQVGDTWGTRALQTVLASVEDNQGEPYYAGAIDGDYGSGTTAAIKQFQPSANLPATGKADAATRDALFAAYMDWLCTPAAGSQSPSPFKMDTTDFLGTGKLGDLPKASLQGCSEFNPIVLLPASEMKGSANNSQRDAADAPNRRVVMFLFQKGTNVDAAAWPCPKVKEPLAACKKAFWPDGEARRQSGEDLREYRSTRDTMACRFYDRFARRSPCERGLASFRIRVYDLGGVNIADAPFEATIGSRKPIKGSASPEGIVTLHDVTIPSQITVRWGLKPEPGDKPDLAFSLEMFLTHEGLAREEEARHKLNNLGYPKEDELSENVKGFQLDYGHLVDPALPVDGSLDQDPRTYQLLQDVYDECAQDIRNTKPI